MEEQPKQFKKLGRELVGRDRESVARFRWICDFVAERKQNYYPHLRNFILEVRFTHEAEGTRFAVLHAL